MDDDIQYQPWYLVWSQYQALQTTKLMFDIDAARARNAVRAYLVHFYPEFFAWIEWDKYDLMGEGDGIVDEFIDAHYPDGLPEGFDFKYEDTRRIWRKICGGYHVN